jgi:hypothetical protein
MSGDGLVDIARIRNGEVCYWPNLGHGRFGAKVTMDGAPHFDTPDLRPRRIDWPTSTARHHRHLLPRLGRGEHSQRGGLSWHEPERLPPCRGSTTSPRSPSRTSWQRHACWSGARRFRATPNGRSPTSTSWG